MSLIKCPECGKMISDKAKRCNGCGMERGVMWNNPSSSKDFLEEKPIVEIVEQSQNAKTDNITEKNISKNLNIKVLIVGLTGIIVWSIVLIYIVNSSFDKKIEKILGSIESSNAITEQGEVVDEINNDEMVGEVEEAKQVESLDVQEQTDVDNNKKNQDGNIVFETSNEEIEVVFTKVEYVGEDYIQMYFLVTNHSFKPVKLKIDKFQYLNDISIDKGYSTMDDEIPSGKSAQLELCFVSLDRSLNGNIESIELRMSITNQNNKEIVFYADGLNIPLKQ